MFAFHSVLVLLVIALLNGYLANEYNRNPIWWLVWSFAFGWLSTIALLIAGKKYDA